MQRLKLHQRGEDHTARRLDQRGTMVKMCRYGSVVVYKSIFKIFGLQYQGLFKLSMANYLDLSEIGRLESFDELDSMRQQKEMGSLANEEKNIENRLETRISEADKDCTEGLPRSPRRFKPYVDNTFQLHFLNQHQLSLQKYIRNYREVFDQQPTNNTPNPNPHTPTNLHNSPKDCNATAQAPFPFATFIEQLYAFEKLQNFLLMIEENFPNRVSLPLIKMASKVWEQYNKLNDKDLNQQEIVETANRMSSSLLLQDFSSILGVTLSKDNEEFTEKVHNFCNFYTITVMFVIYEFFVNPYYQLEEHCIVPEFEQYQNLLYNRYSWPHSNDDEENEQLQQGIRGRKRAKLQTTDSQYF